MTELERERFRAAMAAHLATATEAELAVTLHDLEEALAPRAGRCSGLVRQAVYGIHEALAIARRQGGGLSASSNS